MIKTIVRPIYRVVRRGVHRVRDSLLRNEAIYRLYLRTRWGAQFPPARRPQQAAMQGVLKSKDQWQTAFEETKSLCLPRHPDDPKNWDTLLALAEVLAATGPQARVLDAGSEIYSSFLPALYAYGYRNLTGINLLFQRTVCHGPIRYEPGDITHTRFADKEFDAVACLSVLEHGVSLPAFFAEMARIIKPNGLLFISTDFWETSIDTGGQQDFGAPIHVFNRAELESALDMASQNGFEINTPLDLNCAERAVSWNYHHLQYTYAAITLKHTGNVSPRPTGRTQAAAMPSLV